MIRRFLKFYNKDKKSTFSRLYNRLRGIIFQFKIIIVISKIFTKRVSPDNWILILGNYNSGSTLLRNILSACNNISFLPDESVLYTDQFDRPDEKFGWQRNWLYCSDKLKPKNSIESFKKFENDISPVWIKKNNSIYYLEKTISNLLRIGWFKKYAKNVKFIAIVRNPYSSCEGMNRKSKPVGDAKEHYGSSNYRFTDLARQWCSANEIIYMESQTNENIHVIKYEDLCSSPNNAMKDIFEFLGLDHEFSFIEPNEIRINNFSFKFIDHNQQSLNRLTKNNIADINAIASETMEKLGYEKI